MTTLAPTLSTRYFPNISSRLRDMFLIVAGSLLIAALAQIEILLPFTPVPITGQTFDATAQAKAWFEANPGFGVRW